MGVNVLTLNKYMIMQVIARVGVVFLRAEGEWKRTPRVSLVPRRLKNRRDRAPGNEATHECNNHAMHANECNTVFIIHCHNSVVSLLTQSPE